MNENTFKPGDRVRGRYNGLFGTVVNVVRENLCGVRFDGATFVEPNLNENLELISRPEPTAFQPGDRVRGRYNGLFGTVVDPRDRFVWVRYDGDDDVSSAGVLALELLSRPEPTGATVPGLGIGMCTGGYECPAEEHYEGCFNGPCDCESPGTGLPHCGMCDDDPALDPVGQVRVHPDDDPEDPNARRAWKVDHTDKFAPWVESPAESRWWFNNGVTDWPRQSLTDVARVLGHDDAPLRFIPEDPGLAIARWQEHAERLERENETRERDYSNAIGDVTRMRRELQLALYPEPESDCPPLEWDFLVQEAKARTEALDTAETRASSWWETSKTLSRALTFWHREAVALRGRADESEALGVALDQMTQRAESAERELRDVEYISRIGYEERDATRRELDELKDTVRILKAEKDWAEARLADRMERVANLKANRNEWRQRAENAECELHELRTTLGALAGSDYRDEVVGTSLPSREPRKFRDQDGDVWVENLDGTLSCPVTRHGNRLTSEMFHNIPHYNVEDREGPLTEITNP